MPRKLWQSISSKRVTACEGAGTDTHKWLIKEGFNLQLLVTRLVNGITAKPTKLQEASKYVFKDYQGAQGKKKSNQKLKLITRWFFFFYIRLLKGAQMPQWAVQALRMREAGDTVKMLKKQSILWCGDDAPSGQQALKSFHNKTLSLGHIPEIEGYSTSN